jgi:hypothetical protein
VRPESALRSVRASASSAPHGRSAASESALFHHYHSAIE